MNEIKFIHCADLHLDSPFVGLKGLPDLLFKQIQQSTFQSFHNIVNTAIEEQVDFMIIAGDLFDGEDRSIRAQILFRNEMVRLKEAGIPVYVVHGNHDHLGGNWTELQMPDNVYTFSIQPEMKPFHTKKGTAVHLYGFSYPKKHVFESMIDQYYKVEGAHYHIGILHGHDSQNSEHYSYAPFKVADLIDKQFDYWALGHIHKSAILSKEPYVIYPGNIQGRHKNETGEKGCYLIEMSQNQTIARFIETAPIIWESEEIKNDEVLETFDDLYIALMNIKSEWKLKKKKVFLQINVKDSQISKDIAEHLSSDETLAILQDGEENEDNFVWIYQIKITKNLKKFNHNELENTFMAEMQSMVEQMEDINDPISPLYSHPKAKKFIETLTKEEEEELKAAAQQLLYQLLKG